MSEAAFSLSVSFERVTCCRCGIPFATTGNFSSAVARITRTFFARTGIRSISRRRPRRRNCAALSTTKKTGTRERSRV